MEQWRGLIALNAVWVSFEVMKVTEMIEGALSILGAATLLIINVVRLRRAWNEHKTVEKE